MQEPIGIIVYAMHGKGQNRHKMAAFEVTRKVSVRPEDHVKDEAELRQAMNSVFPKWNERKEGFGAIMLEYHDYSTLPKRRPLKPEELNVEPVEERGVPGRKRSFFSGGL